MCRNGVDLNPLLSQSGRPQLFSENDAHLAARKIATTACLDATDIQRKVFPEVSVETVRCALQEQGLKACISRSKPLLSDMNVKKHRIWASQHVEWSEEDWQQVVFSDESKFNLVSSDGRHYMWRRSGQELDRCFMKKNVKHGGG